ncbi:ISL3 family transposase, partial [Catellatospora sp. NPDC049609]|uniref:ISL3 family transposase n=1 Tax=Catellatospora sp. NPDC049609 TaxID=3155505 RepID=UPI00343F8266
MLRLEDLLPHLEAVTVYRVDLTDAGLGIHTEPQAVMAACPRCACRSSRVHSRYQRTLSDVTIGGRRVRICVRVRRFFCDDVGCAARTFVEQVDGLTARHARRTPSLRRFLEAIGLALCGRAGARLAATLGADVSRSTLIRLVRAIPDPPATPVTVLGVDDFALKRGHHYGTVLIDCQTRQVIDLVTGRDATALATWLAAHPGAEVICRDRSSSYADGARTGAPDAVQVADRFHLWQNLATAVERCVAQHKACLAEPATQTGQALTDSPVKPTGRMAQRRREQHAIVHDLLGRGYSLREIARHLGWGRHTVQRYARAATWQEMVVGHRRQRPSLLDPFKAHLLSRWTPRHGMGSTLYREIIQLGYTGGYAVARAFLAGQPAATRPPLPATPPTVRQVTGWLCRHPDNLTSADAEKLTALLARCPELATANQLV